MLVGQGAGATVVVVAVTRSGFPVALALSAGQRKLSRSIKVWVAICGVENSLVPPASQAKPSRQAGISSVDAGRGWLIFALPPAELAVHPADGDPRHELYLMCDDIEATAEELKGKGVELTRPISDAAFGLMTAIRLPDGGELALYEPKHPTP